MKIFLSTIALFGTLSLMAQDKLDHVLMLSGENKIGQVVGISTETIEFIHDGESL